MISRRLKMIIGIVAVSLIVLSGAIFGLAKTGVIQIKMLADEMPTYGRVEITVDPTNLASTIAVTQNGKPVPVYGGFADSKYVIDSLTHGTYSYQFGMPGADNTPCLGEMRSLSHNSQKTTDTYPKFICDGTSPTNTTVQGTISKSGDNLNIQGATITIGNKSASSDATGHYSIADLAANTYTATVAKTGYETLTQSVTLVAGANTKNFSLSSAGSDQTPHEVTLYTTVKSDCTDCSGRDAVSQKVNGIPIAYWNKEVSWRSYTDTTNNSLTESNGSTSVYNSKIERFMTGTYDIWINVESLEGYNKDYESIILHSIPISSLNATASKEFILKKNPLNTSNGKMTLEGEISNKIVGKIGGIIVSTKVDCGVISDQSARTTCESHKSESEKKATSTLDRVSDNYALSTSYAIEDLYDFSLLPADSFPTITVDITIPQDLDHINYYFDKDGSGSFNFGEDGEVKAAATITRNDIRNSTPKYVLKHFLLLNKSVQEGKLPYVLAGRAGYFDDENSAIEDVRLSITKASNTANPLTSVSKNMFFSKDGYSYDKSNYIAEFVPGDEGQTITVNIATPSGHKLHDVSSPISLKLDKSKAEKKCDNDKRNCIYLIRQDILLEQDISTSTKNFILQGKVKNLDEEWVAGATIEISVKHTNISKTAISETIDPGEESDQNYLINDIPYILNAEYIITNKTLSLQPNLVLNKTDAVTDLDYNQIWPDQNGTYTAKKDYQYFASDFIKKLTFLNASTGDPVFLTQLKINKNVLTCYDGMMQEINGCVASQQQAGAKNAYAYHVKIDAAPNKFSLQFDSDKYYSINDTHPFSDNVIYLIPKDSSNDVYYCGEKAISKLDEGSGLFGSTNVSQKNLLCTYRAEFVDLSNEFMLGSGVVFDKYLKLAREIARIAGTDPRYIAIFVSDGSQQNIDFENYFYDRYSSDAIILYLSKSGMQITSSSDGTPMNIVRQLLRYRNRGAGQRRLFDIPDLSKEIEILNDPATCLNNGCGSNNTHCRDMLMAYDEELGEAIKSSEDIIAYWILHYDTIRKFILRYAKPEDIKDYNSFASIIYGSNAPSLDSNNCVKALTRIDSKLGESGLYGKLRAWTKKNVSNDIIKGATSFDNASYVTILNGLGYTETEILRYNKINGSDYANLSKEQILSGSWLQSAYDKLKNTEKARIQISILSNKIVQATTSSKATVTVRKSLATLNAQMEKWLKAVGFKFSTASIYGTLVDQSGNPIKGFSVNYGKKTDVTDKEGAFSINRVVSGEYQLVTVSDTKIGINYTIRPIAKFSIKDDQKLGPLTITVTRKSYWVRGQIMQGDNPLPEGNIVIADNQTIKLDKDGRFGFQLPEGQYSFSLTNKNGKKLTVTNKGKYTDLPAVKVIAPKTGTVAIDSMIWVK